MEDSSICEKEIYAAMKKSKCGELNYEHSLIDDETDPSGCDSGIESEDEDDTLMLSDTSLFAVFDGHRGHDVSLYASNNFMRVLSCQPTFIQYAKTYLKTRGEGEGETECLELLTKALREAFLGIDQELRDNKEAEQSQCLSLNTGFRKSIFSTESNDAGSTALVIIVNPKWIVCANAGDSRAVLGRNKEEIIALSNDHKPNNDNEKKRIFLAGGQVRWGRVDGDLSVSRGFGDFAYKNRSMLPSQQKITAVPEICVVRRDDAIDQFIFMGCDGIFDVLNNRECGEMIRSIFLDGERGKNWHGGSFLIN